MQDFAYLFPDSAASWLAGRGDARFIRYERYYRSSRAAALEKFDLEVSNERYAAINMKKANVVVAVLKSSGFKSLALFLILLYGGSLIVPVMAKLEPTATGIFLAVGFVAMRVMHRRQRKGFLK